MFQQTYVVINKYPNDLLQVCNRWKPPCILPAKSTQDKVSVKPAKQILFIKNQYLDKNCCMDLFNYGY